MRKWMSERLKRRKKEPEKAGTDPAPAPLQPAFYDTDPVHPEPDAQRQAAAAPLQPESAHELQPVEPQAAQPQEAGIVVLAIDFRNAPEAPYPASLQDINYGIRWLKAHAGDFGSSAAQVGAYGTSSGGHQILLAAIRADDPRYRALPLAEALDMDARLAFVVSGWGVLFPLERYKLAKAKRDAELVKGHDIFFGNEETQNEATPALIIESGEKVYLPPALVFQGTQDQWTTVDLAQRFADDYRKAGGSVDLLLFEGARHTFLNEHPFEPNSVKAVATM